jgi:2-dehydro-3-deoxyphosphogluconate aldolase / (4S)-4-hydroxy-2-oxoglutarate aldolase
MHQKAAVLGTLRDRALIAMLRMPSADDALEMAEVLIEAGITCVQIPLTVPGAPEVITELCRDHGEVAMIGAGTVLDARAAEACIRAGAQFIVSPVLDRATIGHCNEAGVVAVPGALTLTEILAARNAGADMVRIYPCVTMGGPAYLRFVRAPLPDIPLLPAGGVSLEAAADYIASGAAALEVDIDLVDLDALRGGRPHEIVTNAHLYLDVAIQARALMSGDGPPH